jgi:hypothetical protein
MRSGSSAWVRASKESMVGVSDVVDPVGGSSGFTSDGTGVGGLGGGERGGGVGGGVNFV